MQSLLAIQNLIIVSFDCFAVAIQRVSLIPLHVGVLINYLYVDGDVYFSFELMCHVFVVFWCKTVRLSFASHESCDKISR